MSTTATHPADGEETSCSPRGYQICTKTIMDTSDRKIRFDESGISNHFYDYLEQERNYVLSGDEGLAKLHKVAQEIKERGTGRRYDSILGLSGGVDSTYLCLLAKQLGLRPLVVHFDNGWNSELAVHNIENTVKRLGFDLYTYVVDWHEFRELQRSYFKASVVDIEVLTDHGFMAVLYQQARKHRIKYVLGGMNVVTESILPHDWIYDKADLHNIQQIQRVFGSISVNSFKSYPFLSPVRRRVLNRVMGLRIVSPLNWVDYCYEDVKQKITTELNWRDYGGKHHESIFTRFYQGYILPEKFKFDKRRAHLSTLICSGQISRERALKEINDVAYDPEQREIDRQFVLKKLGFSEVEFDEYIRSPRVEHDVFGRSKTLYEKYPALRCLRPAINRVFQS